MNNIISYCICIVILILGITDTIKKVVEDGNINYALKRVIYYISIIITFFIFSWNIDKILVFILELCSKFYRIQTVSVNILKSLMLVAIFFISQISIYFISIMVISPFINKSRKNNIGVGNILLSIFLGVVKASTILGIIFCITVTYNNTIGRYNNVNLFNNIESYTKIQNFLPDYKDKIQQTASGENKVIRPSTYTIVYYNGVTLDDGIKSNDEINMKAKEITSFTESDIEKARNIYSWIGNNIEYDFNKAELALNNSNNMDSGAIAAWENKSGICFDYACLYVAMAREVGLKVRLITGTAFDGKQYGPHAWNEVFITEENKWIPVDSTFYLAGDYFNNSDFYSDHNIESMAGEW